MQISFVWLNYTELSQLDIIHFQNVTVRRLLSLAAADCARGYYDTVQRVSSKEKVFQMKE